MTSYERDQWNKEAGLWLKKRSPNFSRKLRFLIMWVWQIHAIFMHLSRDKVQVEVVHLLWAEIRRINMTLSSWHFKDWYCGFLSVSDSASTSDLPFCSIQNHAQCHKVREFYAKRPDRLWDLPRPLSNIHLWIFVEGKAAGMWRWPVTCV